MLCQEITPSLPPLDDLQTEVVQHPRTCLFGPTRMVPLAEAAGEIAAEIISPYPPGIPLLIPALIATARGAGPLLRAHGASLPAGRWLAILALYDLVFALLAYAVFDFLLEE